MFTIGKLANSTDIHVETVRYYQREGLLPVPEARGGYRQYDASHQQRIYFIKNAQAAGFALKEIKLLLNMDASQDHAKARQLATQRLAAIEQQLEQLLQARSALQRLAHACEHSKNKPCPIIESFT